MLRWWLGKELQPLARAALNVGPAFDVLTATADLVVAPQQASGPAQGGEVTCTGPAAHCGQAEEGGNRGHGSAHICWFETGAVMQRTHLQGLSSKC